MPGPDGWGYYLYSIDHLLPTVVKNKDWGAEDVRCMHAATSVGALTQHFPIRGKEMTLATAIKEIK